MNADATAAITSASAAVLTAIVALLLNHRAFGILDKRIDDTNTNLGRRIDDTNRRIDDTNRRIDDTKAEILRHLERIESDQKEFFKVLAEHDKRIQRLEDN
jgi:TolA-binding protein